MKFVHKGPLDGPNSPTHICGIREIWDYMAFDYYLRFASEQSVDQLLN